MTWKAGWTPAQQAAHERNHKIRQLRCLYANISSHVKYQDRKDTMLNMIDLELVDLGAEPEGMRRARLCQELKDQANG